MGKIFSIFDRHVFVMNNLTDFAYAEYVFIAASLLKRVYFKRTEFASIGNKFCPFQSTSLFWRGLMCRTPNSTKWPKISLNPNTNTIIVSLVKMAKHLLSVSNPLNLLPFTFLFQVALKSEQRWQFFSDEDSTTDAGTMRNSLITGTFWCVQN